MTGRFLVSGPAGASSTLLLAHGAGAPMDSPWMTAMADALAARGLRVVRFEFAYMAGRRAAGRRRPPPRAEAVMPEYLAAVAALGPCAKLVIGGKSMGGRVASMVADDLFASGAIAGLLCLGYPFHPLGRPERPRTRHLETLRTPTLICQGTRDPMGSLAEVEAYALSKAIEVRWVEEGDHDLKPRKGPGGPANADPAAVVAGVVVGWISGLMPPRS